MRIKLQKRGRKRRTRFAPEVMAGYTSDTSRPYHCDVVGGHCGRPFQSVRSLIMHARRSHMGMLAFNQMPKQNGVDRRFNDEEIPSLETLQEAVGIRQRINRLMDELESLMK